ncbi:hypothetical protein UACE39S_02070 [Ureibacillus acetophenoni]
MEISKLTKLIEEIWKNEIKLDYDSNFIFNEDTLKIRFCHHLMQKLTDKFLVENSIRIIPEIKVNKKRVDIAIVRVKKEREVFFRHSEFIEEILVLIELKYIPLKHYNLNQMMLKNDFITFLNDLIKLQGYGKINSKTLLVGAFIHEYFYNNKSGLNNLRSISDTIEKEILDRFIELNGVNYDNTGEFITTVYKVI